MPFTLFHLGPAVLFGILLFRYLDFATFVAANVVVDARAALILFGLMEGNFHGPLQTFIGGTVVGLLLAGAVYWFREPVDTLLSPLHLQQKRTPLKLVAAGVGGTWLHVLLDSFLWTDIQPFYPSGWNPFLGLFSLGEVYGFTIAAGLLSVPLYLYMVRSGRLPQQV